MERAEPFLAVQMSVTFMWEFSGTVSIQYDFIQLYT